MPEEGRRRPPSAFAGLWSVARPDVPSPRKGSQGSTATRKAGLRSGLQHPLLLLTFFMTEIGHCLLHNSFTLKSL